jgi:hypothetical protein
VELVVRLRRSVLLCGSLKRSAWKKMIFAGRTLCCPSAKIMPAEKISKSHHYLLLHHPYPVGHSFPFPFSLSLSFPSH